MRNRQHRILSALVVTLALPMLSVANETRCAIDYEAFLKQHEADLSIGPIPVSKANRNLFGLSEKTRRLPGHKHYYQH